MLCRRLCGLAGATAACVVSGRAAMASVVVSVAYYDNEHPNAAVPTPWKGSPNTSFFGTSDASGVWDGGAIRFNNLGPSDAVLQPGLFVDGFANGASFRLWDAVIGTGLVIRSSTDLVLAQPTTGAFDTSDQPIINNPALRTNNQPIVHFRLDGKSYALTDKNQVLNTGGFDPGEALQISESIQWKQIGTIPEPATLAGGVVCLVAFRQKRSRSPHPCVW